MAQTFDIRFAKSAGLAGLFEAPANEVDDANQGIAIALKRRQTNIDGRAPGA